MKNKIKLLEIIALIAIIGVMLSGCKNKNQRALAELEEAFLSGNLSAVESTLATASPEVIEAAALMARELVDGGGDPALFTTVISAAGSDFTGILTQRYGNPSGDFGFDFNSTGDGVVITYYNGHGGVVIIPAEIDGYPVVEIAARAFSGRSGNRGYDTTPTPIPNPAPQDRFYELGPFLRTSNDDAGRASRCNMITTLIIPDSVKTIGTAAFNNMDNLTSLTLPQNLAVIPVAMVAFSENLSELRNIPTSADFTLFNHATPSRNRRIALASVRVNYAFSGCGKLPLPVRRQLEEAGYPDGF